ncbi:MAG: DUF1571 domain-containing protein [Gemmataceae bacterium]
MGRLVYSLIVTMLAMGSLSLEQRAPREECAPCVEVPCDSRVAHISAEEMPRLAATDPIAFVEQCLARYDRDVHSYRCQLTKQERVRGKLGQREQIQACFREKPFSVRLEWAKGHGLARRTLYVAGAYENRIQVIPAGWRALAGLVTCPVDDEEARANSRYPITQFGLRCGTARTLAAWKRGRASGDLTVAFLGTRSLPDHPGRPCWVLERIERPGNDPEGIICSRFYFDVETWLQVGSELEDARGETVGRYYFSSVEINPEFTPPTFTLEGLRTR